MTLSEKEKRTIEYVRDNYLLKSSVTTISEISEALGFHYRAAARCVRRLVESGYLQQVGGKKTLAVLYPTIDDMERYRAIPYNSIKRYYSLYKFSTRRMGNRFNYLTDEMVLQKVALSIGAMYDRGMSMEDVKSFCQIGIDGKSVKVMKHV